MRNRRQVAERIVAFAFLVVFSANAQMTVLGVGHGAPPDPRPAIRKTLKEQPYTKWEEICVALDAATEAFKQALLDGDYRAAGKHFDSFARFAGKLPTGGYGSEVSQYMMALLYDRQDYRGVLWLAEEAPLAIAQEPSNASHPGAFAYYYLALWKSRGLDAAEAAYRRGVEGSSHQQAAGWLCAAMRTGWIETQLAAGKVGRAAVKRDLTAEALADKFGLSLQTNGAYLTLVALCLEEKDHDCLRRVALQSLFTSEKDKLDHLWSSTLAPLWSLDSQGPEHLVMLTNKYLADCKDHQARARATFFMATMHRLQAAVLYEEVMRNDEADKAFAAENDLHFTIVRQAWTKDSPLETIVVSGEKVAGNSLSQQAARYLLNLAPGSSARRWPMGPASEELRERLRQRGLQRAHEGESGRAPEPPAKVDAPTQEKGQ